jgi:hypothetical protein
MIGGGSTPSGVKSQGIRLVVSVNLLPKIEPMEKETGLS